MFLTSEENGGLKVLISIETDALAPLHRTSLHFAGRYGCRGYALFSWILTWPRSNNVIFEVVTLLRYSNQLADARAWKLLKFY